MTTNDGRVMDEVEPRKRLLPFPQRFHSGDVARVMTPEGECSFRMLEVGDPDWVQFDWSFPASPAVSR